MCHTLFDDAQVIGQGCAQNFDYMQRPGLAKNGADRSVGIQQRLNIGIIFRAAPGSASGTESGNFGMLPVDLGCAFEEFNILGV